MIPRYLRHLGARDFSSSRSWESFDLVAAFGPDFTGYAESLFDGRYVYYGTERNDAGAHSHLLRFDTRKMFNDRLAWETFDASIVAGEKGSFVALAFDKRHVYFAPFLAGRNAEALPFRVCLRYDTSRRFDDLTAWERFDLGLADTDLYGFVGAKVVGNKLYIAPYYTGGDAPRSLFLCYHCDQPFDAPESWQMFDTTVLHPDAKGYTGIETDGRFIYSSPCYNRRTDRTNTMMVRYDLAGDFRQPSSWELFDLAAEKRNPMAGGYHGSMTFDGRHIYYMPLYAPKPCDIANMHHGWITRFDTLRQFADVSAWEMFDTRTIGKGVCGYGGAGFDGRYVYCCPVRCCDTRLHGRVLRYDTRREFGSARAYEFVDLEKFDPRLVYFAGQVAFDGESLYFPAASNNGMMVRFRPRRGQASSDRGWSKR